MTNRTSSTDTSSDKPHKSRKPRWRSWRWLRTALLVLIVFLCTRMWQQRNTRTGTPPPLHALDIDGNFASLDAYKGKPLMLHFWATWCGVCQSTHSSVNNISSDDYEVLTVATQSGSADDVRTWLQAQDAQEKNTTAKSPRVVLDPTGALAQSFGVHAFPTSYWINKDGNIQHTEVGYTTELGMRVRLWLSSL